jgi:hypothetical protein
VVQEVACGGVEVANVFGLHAVDEHVVNSAKEELLEGFIC